MTDAPDYTPPTVWTWTKPSGGTFANALSPSTSRFRVRPAAPSGSGVSMDSNPEQALGDWQNARNNLLTNGSE